MPSRIKASRAKATEQSAPASTPDQANREQILTTLIAESITREEWQMIFSKLARSGSVRAAELLLRYRFGK